MAIFNSYVKLPEGSSGISQPRLIFHRSVEKGVQPPDWQVFYCRLRMSNTPKPSTPSAGVPLLWWLRRQRVKSEMPWCVDPICREGWVSCWGEYMRFFFACYISIMISIYQSHIIWDLANVYVCIYIYTYCAHTDLSWIQIIVDRMMVSDKLQDLIPGHPLVNKDHIDPNTWEAQYKVITVSACLRCSPTYSLTSCCS
jgi:hypothetical protein